MKVVLTLNSHVSFDHRKLKKEDPECFVKITKAFTHKNSIFYKTQRMGYPTGDIPRLIKSFTIFKDRIEISRGGTIKIRKILKNHGHKVKVVDDRLQFDVPVNFGSKIKLQDKQKKPVEVMVGKGQGLLRGPCSSGKTVMLLEAIARAKQPAMVIVWDTNKQKEWIAEVKKFFTIPDSEIGGVGGVFKKRKFGKINICMQQSLWRKENMEFFAERVGTVAADEVQRFAARTFQTAINPFPAKNRWGVSAKEKRKDGMHYLIYDSFGKVIHEIEDKEDDESSRIKAKVFMIPTKFKSEDYTFNNNWTQLLNELTEDPQRNKLILKGVRRSLRMNKFVLILTERRAHALWLRFALKDCVTGMLLGKMQAKEIRLSDWPQEWKDYATNLDADAEFERVKTLGEQRKLNVVIATQKGDVGISIRTLDHLHIVTPSGADIERFKQQKGRIERTHGDLEEFFGVKSQPKVYYYWDAKMDKLQKAGNQIIKNVPGVSVLKLNKKEKPKGRNN